MLQQATKINADPTIPLLVVGSLMFAVGALCLLRPQQVRKYDTRLTRFVKSEADYVTTVRIFGAVFMAIGIILLCLSIIFFAVE